MSMHESLFPCDQIGRDTVWKYTTSTKRTSKTLNCHLRAIDALLTWTPYVPYAFYRPLAWTWTPIMSHCKDCLRLWEIILLIPNKSSKNEEVKVIDSVFLRCLRSQVKSKRTQSPPAADHRDQRTIMQPRRREEAGVAHNDKLSCDKPYKTNIKRNSFSGATRIRIKSKLPN